MDIVYTGVSPEVDFQGVKCKRYESVRFPDHIALAALEQDCWLDPNDPMVEKTTDEAGETIYVLREPEPEPELVEELEVEDDKEGDD
jgi:hypothetical protein